MKTKSKTKPSPESEEYLENPEDIKLSVPAPGKSADQEQDDIFLEGTDGYFWKGKRLEPLSFNRRRAAYAMGLRFGSLTVDEATELEKTGFYRGIDTDVLIVLFLCKAPNSEVFRAIRLPEQALEKALTFGERENLEPGSKEFNAAATFMQKTFVDLLKTQGNYKPAEGKSKKAKRPGN